MQSHGKCAPQISAADNRNARFGRHADSLTMEGVASYVSTQRVRGRGPVVAAIVIVVGMKKPTAQRGMVRVLKSRVVFRGPIFHVSSEVVREPAGIKVR